MKFTMDVTTKKCLMRWHEYSDSVTVAVQSLRYHEELLDVTLACNGKTIRAHKLVLAACSQYFRQVFKEYPCEHPTIILDGICWKDLLGILQFMYCGLVLVEEEAVCSLLAAAYTLDIVGLNYVTEALLEDKYIYRNKEKEVEVVTKKKYDTFEEKAAYNETKLQGVLNNLNAENESRGKEFSARNKSHFNFSTSSTEPNISNFTYNDRVLSRSESPYKNMRNTSVEFDSLDQPQLKKLKTGCENHSPDVEEIQEEQDEELTNGSIYGGLGKSLEKLDDSRRLQGLERQDDSRRLQGLERPNDSRRLERLDDNQRLPGLERPDSEKLQNLEKELSEKKLLEENLHRDSVSPCMVGIRGYPVVNGDGFPHSRSKSYEDVESFSKSYEDDLNSYDNESSQDGSSLDNIDSDMGPAPLPFNHPAVLASSKSAAAAVSAAAAAALASAAANGSSISQMNYAAYLAANSRGMINNSGMESGSPHHNAPSPSGMCLPVWMPPINSISPSPSPPPPGSGNFPPGFIRSSGMSQQDLQTTLEQYQRKLAFHEPRPCPTCQRMYRDAATLRTHIAIMHSEGKEPFTCTCGSVFKTKYDMYQHKKNGHR